MQYYPEEHLIRNVKTLTGCQHQKVHREQKGLQETARPSCPVTWLARNRWMAGWKDRELGRTNLPAADCNKLATAAVLDDHCGAQTSLTANHSGSHGMPGKN